MRAAEHFVDMCVMTLNAVCVSRLYKAKENSHVIRKRRSMQLTVLPKHILLFDTAWRDERAVPINILNI